MAGLIKRFTMRTAYLPTFSLDDPLGPPPPEGTLTSRMGKLFKPRFEIEVAGVPNPFVINPWGDPPPTRWPIIATAGTFAVAVGGALLVVGILRSRSPRAPSAPVARLQGLRRRQYRRRRGGSTWKAAA